MAARRPSEPQIQKQSPHTVEFARFLDPAASETAIPASDLTFSSASSPVERKKKFRLPKIVLQDKKRPDFEVKSCIEINPKIPHNDADIHAEDLQCCPPCDPQDGKGSKYIVERSDWTPLLKAEPGDLACFLAGCPPGVAVCEKHHQKRGVDGVSQISSNSRQVKEDLRKDAQEIARNSSKGRGILRNNKAKPITTDDRGSDGHNTISRNSPMESPLLASPTSTGLKFNNEVLSNNQKRESTAVKSPHISEQESSVTSGSDAFPHAVNSLELGASNTGTLSTSLVTNFTLAGVKSKSKCTSAKEAGRQQRSVTRSQGGIDIPEPLRLEKNRGNRSGSVARAREGIERRSKSEAPPSVEQPLPLDTRRTWQDNTPSKSLGTPGKDLVRGMGQFPIDHAKIGECQTVPKGRFRSAKDETRSTQARGSSTSNITKTDDTAPTEISDKVLKTPGVPAPAPATVRIRTNDSQQYITEIDGKSQADGPSASKSKPPSFVSSRSKALLSKHDLFKPSITESQQLDMGLPLPPVLVPIPVASEMISPNDLKLTETFKIISDRRKEKSIADQADMVRPLGIVSPVAAQDTPDKTVSLQPDKTNDQICGPIVKNLVNIRKAQDLVDGVRGSLQQAEVQMIEAMNHETTAKQMSADKSLATYSKVDPDPQETSSSKQVAAAVGAPQYKLSRPVSSTESTNDGSSQVMTPRSMLISTAKNPPPSAVESKSQLTQQASGYPISLSTQETLNAAYWGFVPAIKEAVQDIVVIAVRNAVNEATIAAAGKHNNDRKSALQTREISKKSSEQLPRDFMRTVPPTSQRDSESTVTRALPVWNPNANADECVEQLRSGLPRIHKELPTIQSSRRESYASKFQENESYQGDLQQPSVDLSAACGQLENVTLDDSKSFITSGKSETYVPPRRSSRNKALLSTNKPSLSAEVKKSIEISDDTKPLPDRDHIQLSRTVRSISSAGSLDEAPVLKDEDKQAKVPLIEQLDDKTMNPINKLSRANTVHWLKELLSNNESYEPQFTALPLRMQRNKDKTILKAKIQSGKESARNGAEGYKTLPLGPVVARPKAAASKRDKRAEASEAFTQTINDLEMLMNEALQIARQAADTQDAPNALGNAAKILKGDRERSEEGLRSLQAKSRRDDRESFPSVHESLMSLSDSDTSDVTEDTEFRYPRPPTPPIKRSLVTLKAEASVLNSTLGRSEIINASTKHSRESQVPSRGVAENNGEKSIDKIKSADPRSMPLESQISGRRKETASLPPQSRNLSIIVNPRSSSKRSIEIKNLEEFSDLEMFEPPPEFRTLEFSRGRATTLKTLGSETSPRRLSPVKIEETYRKLSSQEADVPLVMTSEDPPTLEEEYTGPLPQLTPQNLSAGKCKKSRSDEEYQTLAARLASKSVPGKRQVRDYILENRRPPIQERDSSRNLRKQAKQDQEEPRVLTGQTTVTGTTGKTYNWQDIDQTKIEPCPEMGPRASGPRARNTQPAYAPSYDGSNMSHEMDFTTGYAIRQRNGGAEATENPDRYELRDVPDPNLPQTSKLGTQKLHPFNLKGLNHMSLKDHHLKGFSLARSHKKQKIARDWSPARKRYVAFVSCLSTSLIGLLVGIYAGETPSIQYYIVDLHHYTVLGNVFFFIGLAIPTFFFWPLPLLHGRKPYVLGSMSLAMPLLFPQALAVGQVRSPYVATWRVALILPRAAMGFCLGFANMNFKSMLTDVFGASLQSSNPHQEHADEFDVRRHGGGMGVWLGLWTWSALGSIGVGFMIGAMIINHLSPAWGFYVSITIIAFVMLLNVLVPETRRSAYRRSVAEVQNPNGDVSRRLARGEVKMHMVQTGPKWWGEEFHYGVMLTTGMLRQPGFMVMAMYVAWIYGQMVLIILLLGALMSRDYKFKSPEVAASATAIPLGALLAIPFQKASFLSRARSKSPVSDDATLSHKKVHWSSHMVRRSIFILVLPFAGLGFTLSSCGPPVPFIIPILFAGLIGFLSNLAMAECHGILMETFDTSDLQPGMTGRARGSSGDKKEAKRTNYSAFPRVQSAFAITQGFGYLIASAASGVGGALTRHIGAQAATGVMAGILLVLSLMLLGVLIRFKTVQIVPDSRVNEMEQYHNARRASRVRKEEGIEEDEPFRPIIIGNPHHHTRRMCLLELGGLSRFSEIRIKNKLVDNNSLEAKHPNRAAFMDFEKKIKEKEEEIVHHVRRSLSRHSSRGSRRSDAPAEPSDLGGFREMGVETVARNRSGNVRGSRRDQLRREGFTTRRKISE